MRAHPPNGQIKAPAVAAARGKGTFQNDRDDSTTPIDRLLPKLERVKQTGSDRWIARCPAHDDDSPSLSIRERPDGVLLVKCWAGCGAAEIIESVGLRLRDLFPRDLSRDTQRPPLRPGQRWLPSDALRGILDAALLTLTCAEDLANGRQIPEATRIRLAKSAGAIWAACTEVSR